MAGLLGMLFVLCLLPGCHRQRVPKDELVVLIEQPARSIDPRSTTTSYDFKLSALHFARLVSVDDDHLEPHMDLAESVVAEPEEVAPPFIGPPAPSAPNPPSPVSPAPPRSYRFLITLREGARFSDGSLVEAEDVAYTIRGLMDERTGSAPLRRRFQDSGLAKVEVKSPRALRLTLSHAHASLITDMDFGIVKRGSFAPGATLIGAGPFVLNGPVGEVTRFRANPHYYGGKPQQAVLTVRVIRDANSRLLSLVGGSADMTQNTVSPLLLDVVDRWQGRLKLLTGPSAIFYYLGLNNQDARLRDRRVRQALALAIDRERIVRTKLHGKATLASGLLAPLHWAYQAPQDPLSYDPAQAQKLLDAAGFPDPDGPGPKPRFTLQYKTSTDALPVAIARVIAAQLAEVGIAIELRPLEFHLFLSDVKKGNFQLYTLSSAEIAEPNLYRNFFHSAFIPTAANLDAGLNRMRYRNPELDVLLDQGVREMNREKRRLIYARVQTILARDLPMLPLWHPNNVVVARRLVQGFRMWPSAQLSGLATVNKLPEP